MKIPTEQLIRYIYTTIDVSQFRYEMMEHESDLTRFISTTHYVSPNFSGKNCFLVFTKVGHKFYGFVVDRKQLSYSIEKVSMNNIEIMTCSADVDQQIYNGSIFDGIFMMNGKESRFLITDVYQFKGTDYRGVRLDMKLLEVQHYLNNQYGDQMRFRLRMHLKLAVNQIKPLNELDCLIADESEKIQSRQIRGLCFYPEISGTKAIYMFGPEDLTSTGAGVCAPRTSTGTSTSTAQKCSQFYSKTAQHEGVQERVSRTVYTAKTDEPVFAILEMKQTDTVDIYNLYAVQKVVVDGSTRLKKCNMDIAYIPNIEKSLWCRKIINDSPKKSVFVKCLWKDEKKKWEPYELNLNVRLPSLLEDIEKNLIQIDVSDDSDIE